MLAAYVLRVGVKRDLRRTFGFGQRQGSCGTSKLIEGNFGPEHPRMKLLSKKFRYFERGNSSIDMLEGDR
jgi:hypothetical protein